MLQKNDFEIMCKKLESNTQLCFRNNCAGDDYLCILYAVKQYSENGDNKSKLKSLKALALANDFSKYVSILFSFMAVSMAALSLFDLPIKFLIAAIIIIVSVCYYFRYSYINKWREYILLAIEELE